jgi:surface protein
MRALFNGAEAFNQPIGSWDTSKVSDMTETFFYAVAFNQDISGWDTSQVTRMHRTFNMAYVFNHDIGSWDTSLVTDMSYMFDKAYAFNYNIFSWTGTAATTSQTNMFLDASAFQAKFTCTDADDGPATSCQIPLKSYGASPAADKLPLGMCEGDCDDDSECAGNLACFERSGWKMVPGCSTTGTENRDYCYDPLFPMSTKCDVLYEADSPSLPTLQAATVNFPSDEAMFGVDYAYHVYAEVTVGSGSSIPSYEAVYMLGSHPGGGGGTTSCGSWLGGLYKGKPSIGSRCNYGTSAPDVGDSTITAATALTRGQKYTIEWMYKPTSPRRAQIKVDGVVVVDARNVYFDIASTSATEYLTIGSKYHNQYSTTDYAQFLGSIHTVKVKLCGTGVLKDQGASPTAANKPLALCEGNCGSDSDCTGNLVCFQRDGDVSVPGCTGTAVTGRNYCIMPAYAG